MSEGQIPVTILTGFLGSGKTTLLNRILKEPHGQRIAVIENEFGEAGIDNEILIDDREEQVVVMNNGCICCTVRGDLVRILGELSERRRSRDLGFDRVIIETTGLADPAPVAQTFFVEDTVHRITCSTPSSPLSTQSMEGCSSTSITKPRSRWASLTGFSFPRPTSCRSTKCRPLPDA
jgi:hypothetical protein